MGRRLLVSAGVIAGLFVAAVIAYTAYTALKTPQQITSNNPLNPDNCSPGPCTNVNGFQLWVSNVHLTNDVVRMTVKFQNSSPATHASPEDLQLIDSSRHSGIPITDATGCSTWTRHEFAHKGDTFGPLDICFRVVNTTPPFNLVWSPDEGAFCCQHSLRIDLS
jgi:hypothetical protein